MKRLPLFVVLMGILALGMLVSLPTHTAEAGLAYTNTPGKEADATEPPVVQEDATEPAVIDAEATEAPVEATQLPVDEPTESVEATAPDEEVVVIEVTATPEPAATATSKPSKGSGGSGSISIDLVSKDSTGVTYRISGNCVNSTADPGFGTYTAKWSKSGRITVRAYCKRDGEICAFAQKTFKSDSYPTSTPGATPTPRPHTTTTPTCRPCTAVPSVTASTVPTNTEEPTTTAVPSSTAPSVPTATHTSTPVVMPTATSVTVSARDRRSAKKQGNTCVPVEQVLTGTPVHQYYIALVNWDVVRDANGAPVDLVNPKDSTKNLGGYTTSAAFEGHSGCRQALFNQASWQSASLLYIQDFYGMSRHLVIQPNGDPVKGYMVSWRDPQWIVYVSAKDGFVHRIRPDGTADQNLLVRGFYPINSEDGTKLAVTTLDGYLAVGNADGTDMQLSHERIANPKWLPDQSLVLGIDSGLLKSHDLHSTTNLVVDSTVAYVGDPGEESIGLIVSAKTSLYFLDQISAAPQVLSRTNVQTADYVDWVRPDADAEQLPVQAAFDNSQSVVLVQPIQQVAQPQTTVTATPAQVLQSNQTDVTYTSAPKDSSLLNYIVAFVVFLSVMVFAHIRWSRLVPAE